MDDSHLGAFYEILQPCAPVDYCGTRRRHNVLWWRVWYVMRWYKLLWRSIRVGYLWKVAVCCVIYIHGLEDMQFVNIHNSRMKWRNAKFRNVLHAPVERTPFRVEVKLCLNYSIQAGLIKLKEFLGKHSVRIIRVSLTWLALYLDVSLHSSFSMEPYLFSQPVIITFRPRNELLKKSNNCVPVDIRTLQVFASTMASIPMLFLIK